MAADAAPPAARRPPAQREGCWLLTRLRRVQATTLAADAAEEGTGWRAGY